MGEKLEIDVAIYDKSPVVYQPLPPPTAPTYNLPIVPRPPVYTARRRPARMICTKPSQARS